MSNETFVETFLLLLGIEENLSVFTEHSLVFSEISVL